MRPDSQFYATDKHAATIIVIKTVYLPLLNILKNLPVIKLNFYHESITDPCQF